MSFKENIITSFYKLIRNKKNGYHLFVVSVCVVVLIAVLQFNKNLKNFINASENSNIEFRTLNIAPKSTEEDYGFSKLQNIKHVEFVYNSFYSSITIDSDLKNDKVDGMINLRVTSDEYLRQIAGENVIKNTDSGIMICPNRFYPDSNALNLKINEKEIINGNEFVGKDVTVNYFTKRFEGSIIVRDEEVEQKFNVIGTYDSEQAMQPNNVCYIAFNDIKKLLDKKVAKEVNRNSYYWYVIVDEVKNVDKTMEEIKKMGFRIDDNQTQIDEEQVSSINMILLFITILTMVSLVTITAFYTHKKIELESYNIGLLRALGYKKRTIRLSYIIENFVSAFVSLLIGSLLSIIIFIALKMTFLDNLSYIGYSANLDIASYLIAYTVIIIVNLISSAIVISIKINKNIISLIGEKI
ncbi:MAG: ABC transporter permease [Bacilli bacterium]|nr:ABC transporter permease [Bacilli bacterium]